MLCASDDVKQTWRATEQLSLFCPRWKCGMTLREDSGVHTVVVDCVVANKRVRVLCVNSVNPRILGNICDVDLASDAKLA